MKNARSSLLSLVGVIFVLSPSIVSAAWPPRNASGCQPPATCEQNCAEWDTAEERQICVNACNRDGLYQQWVDNFNGCMTRVQTEKDVEAARAAKEAQQIESLRQQQTQQQSRQQQLVPVPHAITPTPITPTPITPTLISPTPITPTPVNNSVVTNESNLAVGDTFTVPDGSNTVFTTADSSIYASGGSTIKQITNDTWQTLKGSFHFVVKKMVNGRRFLIRMPQAVASIRGTTFNIDVGADGSSVIKVLEGTVNISNAKNKKGVDVKAGSQTIVSGNNAPAKPSPNGTVNTWYQDILASNDLLNESWTETAAATKYKTTCHASAGLVTPTQALTADEQTALDMINQNIQKFSFKMDTAASLQENKASASASRTNVDGVQAWQMFVSSKGVYYPGAKAGQWKMINDKKFTNGMLSDLKKQNIVYDFDKGSMTFSNWQTSDAIRTAVFQGNLTNTGTNSAINNIFNSSPEKDQKIATTKIFLDEKTRLWNKYEVYLHVKSGKVEFPVTETCQIDYDPGLKIAIPTKATSMSLKAGLVEVQKMMGR